MTSEVSMGRRIGADTALRLARAFGTSERYWRMGCFQRSSAMKDPSFDTASTTARLVRAEGQHR